VKFISISKNYQTGENNNLVKITHLVAKSHKMTT